MRNDNIKYDLHIHSTFSDGSYSPREIIELAKKSNFLGLSITDHDSVVEDDIKTFATENEINYIYGIEFSTLLHNVHILGYGIDHNNDDLLDFIKTEKTKRETAAREMCKKARELGLEITFEEVLQEKDKIDGTIGRPHIAYIMVKKGYVKNVYEAFNKWLRKGCPVFVEYKKFYHHEIIEKIKNWGGLAVLAHPGMINYDYREHVLEESIESGIDGLEVYYPRHIQKDISKFLELCYKHNLVITGGSDFHGISKPDIKIGSAGLNQENFERFEKRLNETKNRN